MIDYVEIRNKQMELIGIVDTCKSIFWKSVYYGVGQFEIYVSAQFEDLLQANNYVTIIGSKEVGVIEHIEINDKPQEGRMIVASGRFVKSFLDRRIIFKKTFVSGEGQNYIRHFEPCVLSGNVEVAVRNMIRDNIGENAEEARRINEILISDEDITGIEKKITVIDENGVSSSRKQVSYKNLLEYSDLILQEYELGAYMYYDKNTKRFRYKVYEGVDRSIENENYEPIIFSKEFDNLVSSSYLFDSANLKTCAYIGGDGEGSKRKCSYVTDYQLGLNRREMFIDASDISSKYYNEQEQEIVYSNEEYRKMLESEAKQELSNYKTQETLDGDIDLTNSNLVYGVDYNVGDLITINDSVRYINARILAVTQVVDDDDYRIDVEYGF